MHDQQGDGGVCAVPRDQEAVRGNRLVHADLEPIMDLFTRNIGNLIEAIQRQTLTLADRHQREQEGLITRQ